MGIWHDKGSLKTQQIDNKVRERICEIAQSISIMDKDGAGPEQWDRLIECCISQFSDLVSKSPLGQQYMADKTNLDGQKLKAALDKFVESGVHEGNNMLYETATRKWNLVHIGVYFISPMWLLLFMMMGRYRR